jgi:crossover junction endodeoxyribonuclease RuvC
MIILGIDPGTIVMGYGVIQSNGENVSLIKYGILKTPARSPMGERLVFLYRELSKIILEYKPEVVAVEEPFVDKNVKSAMAIGKAQAVAILAAAENNLPCREYTPSQVKQSVSNYGAGSKDQIQRMVGWQLGLDVLPEPLDASDALAVALCHVQSIRLNEMLHRQ